MTSEPKKIFCIGFVSYFPGKELVENCILLEKFNIPVLIYDNTPIASINKNIFINTIINLKNVTLVRSGENIGLALALQFLNELANEKDFKYLLYLDQDTILKQNIAFLIKLIKKAIKSFSPEVAIQYFLPIKIKKSNNLSVGPNSGSFFNIKVILNYELIPKEYFVEMIDFKIFYEIRRHGLKTLLIDMRDYLDHSNLESLTKIKLIGKTLRLRIYNLKRISEIYLRGIRLIYLCIKSKDFLLSMEITKYLIKLAIYQILARISLLFSNLLKPILIY